MILIKYKMSTEIRSEFRSQNRETGQKLRFEESIHFQVFVFRSAYKME